MKTKSLSDFPLKHILYLAVGDHVDIDTDTGETITLEKQIQRKCKACQKWGLSLWTFRPQGTAKKREKIPHECEHYQDENGSIFAVFTVNVVKVANADNGNENINEKPKSKPVKMHFYESDGKIIPIPDDSDPLMNVTATRSKGDCALIVEEYYKIAVEDNILHCEQYYEIPTFGYGFLNKLDSPAVSIRKKPKTVAYVAKLKAPFIVNVIE